MVSYEKALQVVQEMLRDRGFQRVQATQVDNVKDYMERNPLVPIMTASEPRQDLAIVRPRLVHVICVPTEVNFGKPACRELLNEYENDEELLILYGQCTADVTKEANKPKARIELFTWAQMQWNITKHKLVPEMHAIAPAEAAEHRHRYPSLRFPVLKRSDPTARYWRFPVQTLVRIDVRLGEQLPDITEIRCIEN